MATDGQLLEQYTRDQDEASFRVLVVRHGPTVMRACRRILDDENDVEDAFQATFVVLLRRAPEIQDPAALEHWLYGVARRVALRARRGQARRSEHEGRRAAMQPAASGHRDQDAPENRSGDVGLVVREEVGRLPGKYREAIELCDLSGCTHEEAAGRLGWPLGTLKTRLARGRRRLRDRLDRRGLALGVLLLWLLPRDAEAEVPESLVDATVACLEAEAAHIPHPANPRAQRVRALAAATLAPRRRVSSWLVPLVVVLVLELAATGLAASIAARRNAERDAFATLPAGLTDVLNALCR
jgi:RNA polymerase sigma-70 factor (ECF subfamily)